MLKIWNLLPPAPADFFNAHPELPETVANLLYHRNIRTQEQIDEFLEPDYSQDIHDPFLFKDMNRAVERIFSAIKNQGKIVVHGDYDADGVSASVIIASTLKKLGAEKVEVFLPHREIDGYGLNKKTIEKMIAEKVNLIITCDCGASNFAEVKMAKDNNIVVIITDHHSVPAQLPPADAIIHPLVPGETYPDKGLCGGGVAFKLVQGLLKKHQETNQQLENEESHEAWEKWLLDLVAIATVGDMVPLLGESRTLTKYGLVVLNKTKRLGLQKLLLEARLMEMDGTKKYSLDTETIGWQIAPRINAAGRMNHASAAYELLISEDPTTAAELAFALDKNNAERQKLTEDLVKLAVTQIEESQKDNPVLFVYGKNWSTGIVGLIAGKIKDKYYKPTLVLAENAKPCTELDSGTGDREITGSGRSIDNFSLIGALQSMPEFFSRFGGHPMACGLTLASLDKLEDFKKRLIEKFLIDTAGMDIAPTIAIDAEMDLDNINWELYDLLEKFEPFGMHNERPKYLAKNLTVINFEPVGKDKRHLRLMVKHNSSKIKKVMGWNLCSPNNGNTNWCQTLKKNDQIDVIFEISINEWNGNRELQLTIVDLKKLCDTDTLINADVADNADTDNNESPNGLIYKDLTYKINGILFEVHNKIGRYYNEKQVCDAIEQELKINNVIYEREKILPPSFEGENKGRNKIDFLIENKIIIEVKTLRFVGKEEYYQCLRYLESLNLKLCILINFRDKHLKPKRILNPKAKI